MYVNKWHLRHTLQSTFLANHVKCSLCLLFACLKLIISTRHILQQCSLILTPYPAGVLSCVSR